MNTTIRKTFHTPYKQHAAREGQPFTLVKEIKTPDDCPSYHGEVDAEVLPMYVIKFEDGMEILAWPEEVHEDAEPATIEQRVTRIRADLRLSYANIFVTPVEFDWSQEYPGERWDTIQPDFDDDDDTRRFLEYAGIDFPEQEDSEPNQEYAVRIAEAAEEAWQESDYGVPMMNYYYPIELRHGASWSEIQMRLMLDGGAVTLVEMDGNPVLALTGGGMDLSWDICLAYILCDSYPPLHFCDLPDFAGQTASDKNLKIIAACMESCAGVAHRAERAAIRVTNIAKNLKEPS